MKGVHMINIKQCSIVGPVGPESELHLMDDVTGEKLMEFGKEWQPGQIFECVRILNQAYLAGVEEGARVVFERMSTPQRTH